MTRPTALYVGDNTDGGNWGGRAQSLALMSLLGERFEITGTVPGAVVMGGGPYVRTMLPSLVAHALFYRRDRGGWVEALVRMQERLGARDYITGNPVESAETILKYADKFPLLGRLRQQLEEADVIVVNGEGSGIFSTPYRRDFFFYLGIAELGLRLGKTVYFINTIFSDCPVTGRNTESLRAAEAVLSRCADVHVRDPYSVEYAAETMPSVRCRHVPDALFSWFDRVQDPAFLPPAVGDFAIPNPEEDARWFGRLDFARPYICVGGSSLAAHDPARAHATFRRLVERMADLDTAVYVIQTCGGDRFLKQVVAETGAGFVPLKCPIVMATAILTNARLLVSGRFHPTILASLGGTPCLFLEAHSHKMKSLQQSLGYEDEPMFSTFPDDAEVERIVGRCRVVLDRAASDPGVRERIRSAARARAAEAAQTAELLWARLPTALHA